MKFSTKKFVLQSLLEKAGNVVPTRDVVPVLKNFQVELTDGRIRVRATDLQLTVIAESEMVDVETTGSAVFPAHKLLQIVKEADDGDITVEVTDGKAAVSVGRTQWSLVLQDGDEYPDLPDLDNLVYESVDRVEFMEAINSVRPAASTDSVRANLMMIDVSNGKVRASDGVRFQQVGFESNLDIQIPTHAVDDLLKVLHSADTKTVDIADIETEDSMVFRIGGDVFISQKPTPIFPDVDEILLKPALANDQELVVDRIELIRAIKQVRINADPETSAVLLELNPSDGGLLWVTAKDKYGNLASKDLDVSWNGPARTVAFNHGHLQSLLQMSDTKSCHFYLGADTKLRPSGLLFKDNAKVGLLSQIRVDFVS